jgi:hypothetical protein
VSLQLVTIIGAIWLLVAAVFVAIVAVGSRSDRRPVVLTQGQAGSALVLAASSRLLGDRDPAAIAQLVDAVAGALPDTQVGLVVRDPDDPRLAVLLAGSGIDPGRLGAQLSTDDALLRETLERHRSTHVEDPRPLSRALGCPVATALAIPLDHPTSALTVARSEPERPFARKELDLVESLAAQVD